MTRSTEWPWMAAVGSLLAALLFCICLLAFPAYNNKTGQLELEVAKQDYQRQLSAIDRKYKSPAYSSSLTRGMTCWTRTLKGLSVRLMTYKKE